MLKTFRLLVPVTLVVALAVTGTASAKVIDRARANGDFAVAVAQGTVKNPNWIKVRVRGGDSTTSLFVVIACSRGSAASAARATTGKGTARSGCDRRFAIRTCATSPPRPVERVRSS